MNRVIVTGATGFIGQHTLPLLKKMGYFVHAVSSTARGRCDEGIDWHHVDLFNLYDVDHLMRVVRPTHLLHFAWGVNPGTFWNAVENLSWVEKSLHLVRSFAAVGGKRVVIAGSCAEYNWNVGNYSEQEGEFQPETLYGCCKRALFQILNSFSQQVGLSFAWGYIFHLFGMGEHPKRFVPSIINGLMKGEEVLCSDGNQIRDFLDVRDLSNGFAMLLDSNLIGGVNIGSGKGVTLKSIAIKIAALIGNDHLLKFGAIPTTGPPKLVANVSRIYEQVGWSAQISLSKGLEETVEWWKKKLL